MSTVKIGIYLDNVFQVFKGEKKISKSKLGIVVLSLVGVCRIHLHSLFLTNKYKKVHKKKKFKYSLFSPCLHSFQSSISPHHSGQISCGSLM